MDYIKIEEFQKQDKKAQELLLEWWQPTIFDRIYHVPSSNYDMITDMENDSVTLNNRGTHTWDKSYIKNNYIPLFTETMLRKFIQDKTGGMMKIEPMTIGPEKWYRVLVVLPNKLWAVDDVVLSNLLQAYLYVAVQVALEYCV